MNAEDLRHPTLASFLRGLKTVLGPASGIVERMLVAWERAAKAKNAAGRPREHREMPGGTLTDDIGPPITLTFSTGNQRPAHRRWLWRGIEWGA